MKERRIMGRDSSDGIGEFIFALIFLALGGAVIKKIRENYTPHHDFIDSGLPDLKKISKPVIPEVKVLPSNRQLTYRKKGKEIIDVRKIVRPSSLPYHLEQGWQKRLRFYQGYYRTRQGSFRGEIEERPGGDYKFYIFNPPEAVLTGSHRACFTNMGAGRHHVHFGVNSGDLDSGIMAVERLLYQNLTGR